MIERILSADYTTPYQILVWIGVILAVIWTGKMRDDPANAALPEWDRTLRRAGVYIMAGGLLVTVLFGGDRAWAPWPPMLIIVFGFDFYFAASIGSLYLRERMNLRPIPDIIGHRRRGT